MGDHATRRTALQMVFFMLYVLCLQKQALRWAARATVPAAGALYVLENNDCTVQGEL